MQYADYDPLIMTGNIICTCVQWLFISDVFRATSKSTELGKSGFGKHGWPRGWRPTDS